MVDNKADDDDERNDDDDWDGNDDEVNKTKGAQKQNNQIICKIKENYNELYVMYLHTYTQTRTHKHARPRSLCVPRPVHVHGTPSELLPVAFSSM